MIVHLYVIQLVICVILIKAVKDVMNAIKVVTLVAIHVKDVMAA